MRLKAGFVCPAFFMRLCHLKRFFFFLSFYFDAGADLDYRITSNQKPLYKKLSMGTGANQGFCKIGLIWLN
jgi:hypothetical protein